MKTAIIFFSLAIGTGAFAAGGGGGAGGGGSAGGSAGSSGGSSSGSGTVTAPQLTPQMRNNAQSPLFPAVISNRNENLAASNSAASSNQFVGNTNRFQQTNNPLAPTGSASGTNQLLTNSVSTDQATSQSDQNLVLVLRQRIRTQLGVTTSGAMPVHLVINEGIVTIVGVVPNQEASERILFQARQTPGVVNVVNQMKVGTLALQPEPTAPAFVGNATDHTFSTTDQSLLMSVRQQISDKLHIDGAAFVTMPIHFSIQNGVVAITGRIGTGQQKQELITAVQNTPGVTRVVDNLQLGAEPATAEPANATPNP